MTELLSIVTHLASAGLPVILLFMLAVLWQRLNRVTDELIEIRKQIRRIDAADSSRN